MLMGGATCILELRMMKISKTEKEGVSELGSWHEYSIVVKRHHIISSIYQGIYINVGTPTDTPCMVVKALPMC